jgi:ribosomal protein L11 methyltransferase
MACFNMNSIQISIACIGEEQDILISQLNEFGATGFEQTDTHLLAYFDALDFDSYEVNQLISAFPHQVNEIEEQNWNAVWESNFQPVQVGTFCGIRADFHEPMQGVELEIVITPKMSFGTGHHATTYMMVEQMKDIHFNGKEVFDFGTGTGILAILAEKLGAKYIDAIDVDDWSIENTRENAERNNCYKIQVTLTSLLPVKQYDIVLANINRNVILQYLSGLDKIMKPEGLILFSGLLKEDGPVIVDACTKMGLAVQKQTERNNWVSLLCVKGK